MEINNQEPKKRTINFELIRSILDIILIIGVVSLGIIIMKNQEGWNMAIGNTELLRQLYYKLTEQGCVFLA